MRLATRTTEIDRRRGVVLLAVLVVVVLLTLAAYQFSELMMSEFRAATSVANAAQARAFAESGVNYTAMVLSDPLAFEDILNGNPYDNEGAFREVPVGENQQGVRPGFFSVVAPLGLDDTGSGFRYGVTDEAGKININGLLALDPSGTLAMNTLINLGIPEDTAAAILDWIDADDTPRPGGAESDSYALQIPPYQAKNGPLDTLEELLYVRGVTPELLFGKDRNRNGLVDDEESSSVAENPTGWSAFLTVYSREQNVDSEGLARLFVNGSNTAGLYDQLLPIIGPEMTNYLLAYRIYGPYTPPAQPEGGDMGGMGGQGGNSRNQPVVMSADQIDRAWLPLSIFGTRGTRRLSSLFELMGTEVLIRGDGRSRPDIRVASPLNDPATARQLLPLLLEKCSTTRDTDLPSRVNVLTAPSAVLAALPAMTAAEVDAIVRGRPDPADVYGDPVYSTPAWLVTEAGVKPETMRTLERFVTSRTQVYRMQVIGHFEDRGPTVRVEAIVDVNRVGGLARPRIVYWRDLSELGRGFILPQMQQASQ